MRIEYAGSVHDEEEIEAVVSVLRGGPSALPVEASVPSFRCGDKRVTRILTARRQQRFWSRQHGCADAII